MCSLSAWIFPLATPIQNSTASNEASTLTLLDRLIDLGKFVSKESRLSLLSVFLNILWIVTGGLWMAVAWLIAMVLMAITIVGLPWARAAFNIAGYTLLPFGHVAVPRAQVQGYEDLGTGPLGTIGNIIWLLLAGWWLALGHLITAILLAVTIIGLPFAWAHIKFIGISLWPVGKVIVTAEEAEVIRSNRR